MLKRYLSGVAMVLAALVINPAWALDFDEGIEYQLIKPAVPTSVNSSKVEVVELFWYGCPHCYSLEPKVNQWKKGLGKNVEFVRIPAVFANRPAWELHARAYYTADLLGILDKVHPALFDIIHKQKKHLHSVNDLAEFFTKFGVDKATFKDTMYSFGVGMKLNRAKDLTKRYGINGVPTIVVDGRYLTHASLTNGQANMLKVTDFLINKESKTKK